MTKFTFSFTCLGTNVSLCPGVGLRWQRFVLQMLMFVTAIDLIDKEYMNIDLGLGEERVGFRSKTLKSKTPKNSSHGLEIRKLFQARPLTSSSKVSFIQCSTVLQTAALFIPKSNNYSPDHKDIVSYHVGIKRRS